MKQNVYTEKERTIEIIDEVDVLVVGGGPAGMGAAIGAARTGAATMIIENMGSFGGMWTNGLVITLGGFNNWLKPWQRCVNGVMGEWLVMAEKRGGAENSRSWVLDSDPEIMKIVADELILNNKVKCLLHTWMADVIMQDNCIKGILIENVDGRKAIMAKRVVDCTGNGDVFARAGASFNISPELQPMTLPFYFAEVEPAGKLPYNEEVMIPIGPEPGNLSGDLLYEYMSSRRDIIIDRTKLKEAQQKGEFPEYGGPWFGGLRRRFPWVNTTRVYASGVNAAELTAAEMEARKNAHQMMDYYRRNFKEFRNSWIMKTSSTIGIRETRRLTGMYTLTAEDILSGRKFDDSIAVGSWPIDVHPQKGQSGQHTYKVPLPFNIPYRTLLPEIIDNLAVAGRCISVDRETMGSIRVGATCGAIGHAAGIAAALSAKSGDSMRKFNYKKIQRELLHQNAIID